MWLHIYCEVVETTDNKMRMDNREKTNRQVYSTKRNAIESEFAIVFISNTEYIISAPRCSLHNFLNIQFLDIIIND